MEVSLFGISQYGKSKNVTAQNRINCYLEPLPGDDRSRVAVYGTPGLNLFTSLGETPVRGISQYRDFLYAAHRDVLYQIDNSGNYTALGNLLTDQGRVYMASNGTQLFITDGFRGYIYYFNRPTPANIATITHVGTLATLTTSTPHGLSNGVVVITGATPAAYNGTFDITVLSATTFTYEMLSNPGGNATVVGLYTTPSFNVITAEGYPGAKTATWQDSYFIVNPPTMQRFYISGSNNGLAWDALDFSSAESNPDNLVAVFSDNSTVYLFGDVSTEFWTNTGDLDFPFARISGGATEWGCAAVDSISKYDNTLAFLARNRMGEVIVAKFNGYAVTRISNPELEYIINHYQGVSDAVAFSYMLGGHPMYQINFPSAEESWLYDGLSGAWTKLISHNLTRHRAELGVNYLNKIMVTDFENGNIYRLNPDSYTDNGEPIAFEIVSKHLTQDELRFVVDKLQLVMETGVGIANGQGSNPQIMLSVSKDGGHTWGTEQWIDIGKIGEYETRAVWWRLGVARDFVFKIRITDPVKRCILGASIQTRSGVS